MQEKFKGTAKVRKERIKKRKEEYITVVLKFRKVPLIKGHAAILQFIHPGQVFGTLVLNLFSFFKN